MSESHPVDVHVGALIRARRKEIKLSQQALAAALGLTFQQVQKYESGHNRISASKLYAASKVLNMPVSAFFNDLPPASGEVVSDAEFRAKDFLSSGEGIELAQSFTKLSPAQRRGVLALVKSLLPE